MESFLVFVYGTLKYGKGNWRWALSDSEYLGPDTTEDTYIMGNVGFPYIFPKHIFEDTLVQSRSDLFKPVKGDVFKVNQETLDRLDRLEGIPHHYQRVTIQTKGGHECFCYINEDKYDVYHCRMVSETQEGEWEW